MKFFTLNDEIAMDLGTANTLIIHNDKIMIDEPSVVAINYSTGDVIAVGREAWQMQGKTHENIQTIRPLRDGVIASFTAAAQMIRHFIRMADNRKRLFGSSFRMLICIPSGSTEVEARAVRESAEQSGAREVHLIDEPMAAAIGIGLDVTSPTGNMIIDIGGGTTEIAVISLGNTVCSRSINIAGDVFTSDILEYMRNTHRIKIGERTAEQIKISVGAVADNLNTLPEDFTVYGPNLATSLPVCVTVGCQEIVHCLDRSVSRIETAILNVLEQTPPELYADIIHNGIYLVGGGALLRGLDARLREKIQIPFKIGDDPLRAVARGTGLAMKHLKDYPFLFR